MADLFDRYRVIDMDTHVTEPPEVWTDRVSSKWGDRIPHIRRLGPKDLWFVGDTPVGAPGAYSAAGHDGTYPDFRDTYEDIPAATYDAKARLAMMDEEGVYAQVLYPNVGGFGSGRFLELDEPALMLECVQAYNDFLIDWCSADPARLIPVMALPFWDVGLSVKEIERSAARGHRAILAGSQPQVFGQPLLRDRHWDPIWAAARETGLPISFHVGAGDLDEVVNDTAGIGTKANFARASSCTFIENWQCMADLIFGGVCHRFPEVDFVSVESGAGWLHPMLEMFDWQWVNSGVTDEHPEYDLMPSDYFKRQVYGSFWFENAGLEKALELLPDNLMYETDYPHPTCMAPGPKSSAEPPRVYADKALSGIPDETLQKVLHDTAARLYGIE
jgi:predicted TIM-barrel fold metal-dependent hydrolase